MENKVIFHVFNICSATNLEFENTEKYENTDDDFTSLPKQSQF